MKCDPTMKSSPPPPPLAKITHTPKTTAASTEGTQRAARSPVQAVHVVGPFAVLVPVSVVHHQHLLLRLQHFLKDAEKRKGFLHSTKKKRTFRSSPTSRRESPHLVQLPHMILKKHLGLRV